MKALLCRARNQMQVENIEDARVEPSDDVGA
jgi:hypothetical protein